MRLATIDIGTNTVLLLVAERTESGALVAVEEHATITRLGEGVDRTRSLLPEAIARTNACLERYAEIVARLGVERVAVVGTSAMRDAGGGDEVRRRVEELFGVEARTISGEEEARLTFAGALSGLGVDATSAPVAVFDIGGGSTEIVIGKLRRDGTIDRIEYAHSFDVGSVRLTERHVRNDPPTHAELDAIRKSLRDAFAELPPLPDARDPIGIAGTVTTLAAVSIELAPYDPARVHGLTLPTAELSRVVDRLAAMPLDARRSVTGLEPKRADVIVAGGMIALALLERWNARDLRVSDRGVRWGLALELGSA